MYYSCLYWLFINIIFPLIYVHTHRFSFITSGKNKLVLFAYSLKSTSVISSFLHSFNMSMWLCPCDFVHVTMSMRLCPCDYVHVTVSMWLCPCEYVHVTMVMWLWSCDCVHVNVSMWLCPYDYVHVTMSMWLWEIGSLRICHRRTYS